VEFIFGDHRLDVDRRELWLGDRLIALAPQVFDLLVYLLCNRERVVTKDDLLEAVWGGRIVSESALTTRINAVRRAVGGSGQAQRLIRTIPRKGFRFVGAVEEAQEPEASINARPGTVVDPQDRTLRPPDKPSIAVLPFANLSGDPEQDHFADGMVEEIVTALSRVRWFLVIARNSTLAYKDKAVDVREVGRQLGVRYVLEGSLRKSGTRIRVTALLVEAATANHVWAERYDREAADIFTLQDEITERVVGAIEPELYAAEHFRCQRKPPDSLDAWECVIRALSQVRRDTRVGCAEAKALCRRAIAIAPDYGQAHSLLAWVLLQRISRSVGDVGVVLPEAMAEARIALSLDERDAWAHMVLGVVLWRMRRGREAERAHRRALELNPNFAGAHAHLALVLAIHGSHQEAAETAAHALRLSPNDLTVGVFARVAMAAAHFAAGRYAEAMAWARDTTERAPEHPPARFLLVASAAMQGDLPAAAEALGALFRVVPNLSLTWMRRNTAYVGEVGDRLLEGLRRAGLPDEAAESERVLATVLFTTSSIRPGAPPRLGTAAGASCSIGTMPPSGRSWRASTAARSRPSETAFLQLSGLPREPCAVLRRSSAGCNLSASRCARVCTLARSSCGATRSAGLPSILLPASPNWRVVARSWSPPPCATSWPAPASASATVAATL
jgi:TolB-like protein/tetratricopeptide (TPR) repeat protein